MIDRRSVLAGGAASLIGSPALAQASMTRISAHQFSFAGIDGSQIRLSDYRGKVLMVVNTACQCGYTPQFAQLQQVWMRLKARGLVVIGVPSNDFGGQDPGSDAEIAEFVSENYGITFLMTAKQTVRGANAHPFYRWAARERPADLPRWNFHKYLIGKDGQIAGVFGTGTPPTDPLIALAIEDALTASV